MHLGSQSLVRTLSVEGKLEQWGLFWVGQRKHHHFHSRNCLRAALCPGKWPRRHSGGAWGGIWV